MAIPFAEAAQVLSKLGRQTVEQEMLEEDIAEGAPWPVLGGIL